MNFKELAIELDKVIQQQSQLLKSKLDLENYKIFVNQKAEEVKTIETSIQEKLDKLMPVMEHINKTSQEASMT